jgi:hypothetical protein
MGTRHLIMVMHEGEYKVAQYGQFDGYPSCRGVAVLDVLRGTTPDQLRERMAYVEPLTLLGMYKLQQQQDKYIERKTKEYQKAAEPNPRDKAATEWFAKHPELSRGYCEEILTKILDNKANLHLPIKLDIEFAADSLFCEWAYVIDLDKNKLEVYEGYNKKQLGKTARFAFLNHLRDEAAGYHPIAKVTEFDLNKLPSNEDFIRVADPKYDN